MKGERGKETGDLKNLHEQGFRQNDNVGPLFTKGDMGDRPVPNIGMEIVRHGIQIIGVHEGRQETDEIHQNRLGPGIQNDSDEGGGIVRIRAGAKVEELAGEAPFHLNEGHVARQEDRRDEDDGLGAVEPIRHMVHPGFRCFWFLVWVCLFCLVCLFLDQWLNINRN